VYFLLSTSHTLTRPTASLSRVVLLSHDSLSVSHDSLSVWARRTKKGEDGDGKRDRRGERRVKETVSSSFRPSSFFLFSFFFLFFFFGKVNFTKKFEPIFNLILNVLIFAMHLLKFFFFFFLIPPLC
jgi:hypothetical protein